MAAKLAINRQPATIITIPIVEFVVGSTAVAVAEKTQNQTACQIPPKNRGFLRPNRPRIQRPHRVQKTFTGRRVSYVAMTGLTLKLTSTQY